MQILHFPDPFLLQPTEPVTVFESELKILLDSMWETMIEANGVGLAANQVGLSFQMFIMNGPEGRLNLINPKIVAKSIKSANIKEGCLSAIGEFITIPSRADWVQVQYQDEKGNHKSIVLKEVYSVIAQHEIDHLLGKSFMQDKSISKNNRIALSKKWGLK